MSRCRSCGTEFEITDEDRELLARLSPRVGERAFTLPEPSLCPRCRLQRRLAFRGELNLFRKESAASGKKLFTYYPPEAPVQVLSPEEYWSDTWDPRSFGRDFDFSRPFFEQFSELLREARVVSLTNSQNQNSEYINCSSFNKDCYLLAGANYNDSCSYGNYVNHCVSCFDCTFVERCELCLECVDCSRCYNLRYSQNSHDCYDSYFLKNCRSCRDCFACVNLTKARYCILNKQLSKDEYEQRIKQLRLHTRSGIARAAQVFKKHSRHFQRNT